MHFQVALDKLEVVKTLCIFPADMEGILLYEINADLWESPVYILSISSCGIVAGKLHFSSHWAKKGKKNKAQMRKLLMGLGCISAKTLVLKCVFVALQTLKCFCRSSKKAQ